jgi:hypothetical protein
MSFSCVDPYAVTNCRGISRSTEKSFDFPRKMLEDRMNPEKNRRRRAEINSKFAQFFNRNTKIATVRTSRAASFAANGIRCCPTDLGR